MDLLLNDLDFINDDGRLGNVVVPADAAGFNACDGVQNVKAVGQLAKAGVLRVKVGRVLVHDEELRGSRVGIGGARHGKNAARMLQIVLHKAVGDKLTANGVCGFLLEAFVKAAALNHKALDDAVEDDAAVEAGLNQGQKVLYGGGCLIGIKLCGHFAKVANGDFNHGVFHNSIPFGVNSIVILIIQLLRALVNRNKNKQFARQKIDAFWKK